MAWTMPGPTVLPWQDRDRINGHRIVALHPPRFKMHGRTSIAGSQSNGPDLLAGPHIIAVINCRRTQMPIDCSPAITVHDENSQSLPRQCIADIGDATSGCCNYSRARRGSDVDPVVALSQSHGPETTQDVTTHRPLETRRAGHGGSIPWWSRECSQWRRHCGSGWRYRRRPGGRLRDWWRCSGWGF